MQDLSAIDDYFDQVVKGLPYEKLQRIERNPAGVIKDPNSVLNPLGAQMPAKDPVSEALKFNAGAGDELTPMSDDMVAKIRAASPNLQREKATVIEP